MSTEVYFFKRGKESFMKNLDNSEVMLPVTEGNVQKKYDCTAIIPALNEEMNIQEAINMTFQAFEKLGIAGQIVVINDGSTDRTEDIVQNMMAKDSRLKMIKHNVSMGVGTAFWDGVDCADGETVVIIPGDNENDPLEILRYCKLLDHVDIVIPFVFNKEVRSLFRNALSFIYRFIINTTFVVNFNYTNGMVLYRKSILKNVDYRSKSFFFQTDILIRTIKQRHYLFAEVPCRLALRNSGKSNAVSFPSLMKVIKGYIRLVRDIYFNTSENIRKDFTKDSLTEKRRNSLD